MHRTFVGRWSLVAVCIAAAACSDREKGASSGSASGASAAAKSAALDRFFVATEPAGAKPVKVVVASAKTGDEVTVTGRVGVDVAGRAAFTLVDSSVKACSEIPDPCKTPWDFCCEPSDEFRKESATVEFRDGARVIAAPAVGAHGLDHLGRVVVKGRAEKDPAGNLIVVASGIYLQK